MQIVISIDRIVDEMKITPQRKRSAGIHSKKTQLNTGETLGYMLVLVNHSQRMRMTRVRVMQ